MTTTTRSRPDWRSALTAVAPTLWKATRGERLEPESVDLARDFATALQREVETTTATAGLLKTTAGASPRRLRDYLVPALAAHDLIHGDDTAGALDAVRKAIQEFAAAPEEHAELARELLVVVETTAELTFGSRRPPERDTLNHLRTPLIEAAGSGQPVDERSSAHLQVCQRCATQVSEYAEASSITPFDQYPPFV